ncbi:MAG: outer membrane protein assembly factor BamD [Alphaproteobacteria bacterium]|nr:outer membrane protein assembly factor BamD [Alphaproteobacteria bacterium]
MFRRFKPYSAACLALALVFSIGLSGCASKKKADADKQVPVATLYNDAAHKLDTGDYGLAAKGFDDVDRQYPYSQWATRAQLMAGYAHYKKLNYDEAILSLDRFIELHPGDPNAAYAYYLRALCYYEQISDVRRDQKMTQLALDNLQQVVTRFPASKYARDAALKIDLTQDHLAGKEMEIGRYYLERNQFTAALPRFRRVVEQYQTTTQVPEALERMVECYLSLGLREEAKKTAAILGYNYPDSTWYKDAYRLLKKSKGGGGSLYDKTLGKIL